MLRRLGRVMRELGYSQMAWRNAEAMVQHRSNVSTRLCEGALYEVARNLVRSLGRTRVPRLSVFGMPAVAPSTGTVFDMQLPASSPPARPAPCCSVIASWRPSRFGLTGILAPARAKSAVALWRAKSGASAKALPPESVLAPLFSLDSAPTALAQRNDVWVWWPGGRRVSTQEICGFFGVPRCSRLVSALSAPPTTSAAAAMLLGKSVSSGVAEALSRRLIAVGALVPPVLYSSGCSGIDGFYPGLRAATGGRATYVHAAESADGARRVLAAAYGLRSGAIHKDVRSTAACTAERTQLRVDTPDCNKLSRRFHGRCDTSVAEGAVDAYATLGYLRRGRAEVAIIENVAERDSVEVFTEVVTKGLPGYKWSTAVVCPRRDCGGLMDRERLFLIGYGPAAQRRVAATSAREACAAPEETVIDGMLFRASALEAPTVILDAVAVVRASGGGSEPRGRLPAAVRQRGERCLDAEALAADASRRAALGTTGAARAARAVRGRVRG